MKNPNLEKLRLIETRFLQHKQSAESISFDLGDTVREIARLKAEESRLLKGDPAKDAVSRRRAALADKRAQLTARYEAASQSTKEAIQLLNACKEFLQARGIAVE